MITAKQYLAAVKKEIRAEKAELKRKEKAAEQLQKEIERTSVKKTAPAVKTKSTTKPKKK